MLEWLDAATRSLGASLDKNSDEARSKLGKLPLSAIIKEFKNQERDLDSTVNLLELQAILGQ